MSGFCRAMYQSNVQEVAIRPGIMQAKSVCGVV